MFSYRLNVILLASATLIIMIMIIILLLLMIIIIVIIIILTIQRGEATQLFLGPAPTGSTAYLLTE